MSGISVVLKAGFRVRLDFASMNGRRPQRRFSVSVASGDGQGSPTLPDNPLDAARVDAVRALKILDTATEPLFDRLTAMAARACGASHALLVIVDDLRCWPKAAHGFAATEAPRATALLAARTLADNDVFVVEDAAAGGFPGDPWLVGTTGVRGFAGRSLVTQDGHVVGLLAVFDRVPRPFSSTERNALRDFAAVTLAALERPAPPPGEVENEIASLRDEADRLNAILLSMSDAVAATDASGAITFANDAACSLLRGTPGELAGLPLEGFFLRRDPTAKLDSFSPPDPISRILESGETVREPGGVWVIPRNGAPPVRIGGHTAPLRDSSGAIRGAIRVFHDTSGEERFHADVLRADNFEKLAALAGGIAHGFNNALTAISGNLSLADMLLRQSPDEAATSIAEAQAASAKAADLSAQLLAFSRGATPVKKLQLLSELVEENVTFALRGSKVQPVFTVPESLPLVELDPTLFGRVVRNLVFNAVEAMPKGGKLEIWAVARELPAGHPTGLTPGRYVKLCFEDEGEGIPPENLNRIFSPFFTTKAGGSGIGLSAVYAIVRQHGGQINVDSIVGRGTIFRVYLPVAAANDEGSGVAAEDDAATDAPRVLVLDDEASIRALTVRVLHQLGYGGRAVGDGDAFIREFTRAHVSGRGYQAILLDLTIPGGPGGVDVLRRVLEVEPRACAIAMSGYMPTLNRDDLVAEGFFDVLAKPYAIAEIADTIGRAVAHYARAEPH